MVVLIETVEGMQKSRVGLPWNSNRVQKGNNLYKNQKATGVIILFFIHKNNNLIVEKKLEINPKHQ